MSSATYLSGRISTSRRRAHTRAGPPERVVQPRLFSTSRPLLPPRRPRGSAWNRAAYLIGQHRSESAVRTRTDGAERGRRGRAAWVGEGLVRHTGECCAHRNCSLQVGLAHERMVQCRLGYGWCQRSECGGRLAPNEPVVIGAGGRAAAGRHGSLRRAPAAPASRARARGILLRARAVEHDRVLVPAARGAAHDVGAFAAVRSGRSRRQPRCGGRHRPRAAARAAPGLRMPRRRARRRAEQVADPARVPLGSSRRVQRARELEGCPRAI